MTEKVPEYRTANMGIRDLIKHVRNKSRFLPKGSGIYLGYELSAEAVRGLRSHLAAELIDLRRKLRDPERDVNGLWQVEKKHFDRLDQFNAEVVEEGVRTY